MFKMVLFRAILTPENNQVCFFFIFNLRNNTYMHSKNHIFFLQVEGSYGIHDGACLYPAAIFTVLKSPP